MIKCATTRSCKQPAKWGVQGRGRGLLTCHKHLEKAKEFCRKGYAPGPVRVWKHADTIADVGDQLELDLGSDYEAGG